MLEMNREASFEEFVDMFRQYSRIHFEINPIWRDEVLEMVERQSYIFEAFLNSTELEDMLRDEYKMRCQRFQEMGDYYRWVYCLEDYSHLDWVFSELESDEKLLSVKPSPKPVVPLPKFGTIEDSFEPLTENKFGPTSKLSALRPTTNMILDKEDYYIPSKRHRFSSRFRRKSKKPRAKAPLA